MDAQTIAPAGLLLGQAERACSAWFAELVRDYWIRKGDEFFAYTRHATLAAAAAMGLTVIGLINRYIYRKRKKTKRYFEITNIDYKNIRPSQGKHSLQRLMILKSKATACTLPMTFPRFCGPAERVVE